MNKDYRSTEIFWDSVFKKLGSVDPRKPLSHPELEEAIKWVARDAKAVLDFGCGHGRALFRCLEYGTEKAQGLDISREAVAFARKTAEKAGMGKRVFFECCGLDYLAKMEGEMFDGIILFNIIDNLFPEDAKGVVKEAARLLAPRGKAVIKLNQYIDPETLEQEEGMEKAGENFFRESSGIYFWNIDDNSLKELVDPYFEIKGYNEVHFPGEDGLNRLYFLKKKTV